MIESFPRTAKHLSANAKIVQDPDFRSGIIKILDGKERSTGNLGKTDTSILSINFDEEPDVIGM